MEQGSSWNEYRRLVLKNFEQMDSRIAKLEDAASRQSTEIALLKLKAGVWGLIGAAIPVVSAALFMLLKH